MSIRRPEFLGAVASDYRDTTLEAMAATFVSLHVASDAESLSTPLMWALEWLLPGMRVRVDSETGWTRESFVAGLADVSILGLRERCHRRRRNIVMVLPWIISRRWSESYRDWH